MNETFNRYLSLVTFAGIAGLVILNWRGANTLLATTAKATTDYVRAVQGR